MAANGWIKIHRALLEHFITDDPTALSLWVHLLLLANHSDKKRLINGKPITIKRGQLMTSRPSLSSKTSINQSRIERLLNMLESEQMIEQQKFSKYRLISITKYQQYQLNEQVSEQQTNSKRTADEQQMNTLEECKEGKECKEQPKKARKRAESFALPEWINQALWDDFMTVRKQIKAANTDGAKKALITKLVKLQQEGHDPHESIAQSIENSWKGVFPVKSQQAGYGAQPQQQTSIKDL